MGLIYPSSMLSKPRGLVASGDWVTSLLSFSPIALYAADRGLYKAVAASFAAASSEYLERSGIAAGGLHPGDTDWTVAGWFYALDVTATRGIASQTDGTSGLRLYTSASTLTLDVLSASVSIGIVASGAITNNTWHFFVAQHNAATNKIGISLDGGAVVEASTTGACVTSGSFFLGALGGLLPFDGRIDSVGFWNRLLTTGEITSLRNGGSGKNYADLSVAEKVSLAAWWDLDELSGNRSDSSGNAQTLTDTNTVTSAAGKPNKLATAASDPIGLWLDQSGNERHLSAAALANQPTLALAYQNGKSAVVFDGVDDYMLASAFQAFPSKRGVLVVVEKTTLAVGTCQLCGTYSAAVVDWLAYVTKSGTKYNWYDGVSDLVSATFDGAATELEVWSRDGDASISHRRNAALADALTCANNQPSSDVLAVGASTTGGTPYKGGIMTIALFGDKTLAEVQAIESILNSAWAVY